MKKIVEKIKTKKKLFIGIIIGGIVVSLVGVVGTIAANTIASNYVLYDSSTGKNNVKDAIDELYTMANTHCPDGYICTQAPTMVHRTVFPPTGNDTYLAVVYLDPTNLSRACNERNSVSLTDTKASCMKWYAYKDNGTSYSLILDHNINAYIQNTSDVLTKLNTITINWVKELNPSLISAEDIWEITKGTNGAPDWDSTIVSSFYFEGKRLRGAIGKYYWLYERMNNSDSYAGNISNSDSTQTHSYVTGLQHPTDGYMWSVKDDGSLGYGGSDIRPVITIPKS